MSSEELMKAAAKIVHAMVEAGMFSEEQHVLDAIDKVKTKLGS